MAFINGVIFLSVLFTVIYDVFTQDSIPPKWQRILKDKPAYINWCHKAYECNPDGKLIRSEACYDNFKNLKFVMEECKHQFEPEDARNIFLKTYAFCPPRTLDGMSKVSKLPSGILNKSPLSTTQTAATTPTTTHTSTTSKPSTTQPANKVATKRDQLNKPTLSTSRASLMILSSKPPTEVNYTSFLHDGNINVTNKGSLANYTQLATSPYANTTFIPTQPSSQASLSMF